MLDEKIIEKLSERLVARIEVLNEYILKEIGSNIKALGEVIPKDAYKLAQILKYGGNYNKITRKIAEITELNVKDIYKIFKEIAKENYYFAEQFYDYRGVEYIPYEQNISLQNMVRAIANITTNQYLNISETLGFATKDNKGNIVFTELSKMYQKVIDESVIAVVQGKDSYQNQMKRLIKELGQSGIKSVDYASGYYRRLDSAVRMNIRDGMRNISIELQNQFGKEFGADGIEISVHENPADDHDDVQGRQFSIEEFEKFQNGEICRDYQGNFYYPFRNKKNRRPIGKMNCYHYIFNIILGVSKPNYSDEQLDNIIKQNNKGFEFEGKHYSMYKGTQLQRKIETEIRKQKELNILAKSSDNKELIQESNKKIRQLTLKYNQLSKTSKLPPRIERARVIGYRKGTQ